MSTGVEKDFLVAAQTNNCFKLKNLLHYGVNIDCVDGVSDTKLICVHWVKLLFVKQKGQTALHMCSKGHVSLVQFLCSSGANTELQDKVIVESCLLR